MSVDERKRKKFLDRKGRKNYEKECKERSLLAQGMNIDEVYREFGVL